VVVSCVAPNAVVASRTSRSFVMMNASPSKDVFNESEFADTAGRAINGYAWGRIVAAHAARSVFI